MRNHPSSVSPTYKVPRRFGLGTVLIVTTLFALLFGVIRWTNAPPVVLIFYSSFVVMVGGAQMILERSPRLASIMAGAVFLPLSFIAAKLVEGGAQALTGPALRSLASGSQPFWMLVFGALLGYLGGTMIAGLFLVLDQSSRALRRARSGRSPLSSGVS